jgi:hypothetical protein
MTGQEYQVLVGSLAEQNERLPVLRLDDFFFHLDGWDIIDGGPGNDGDWHNYFLRLPQSGQSNTSLPSLPLIPSCFNLSFAPLASLRLS